MIGNNISCIFLCITVTEDMYQKASIDHDMLSRVATNYEKKKKGGTGRTQSKPQCKTRRCRRRRRRKNQKKTLKG